MRQARLWIGVAVSTVIVGCGSTAPKQPLPPDLPSAAPDGPQMLSSEVRAKMFVDLLVKSNFAEAVAGFDAAMKQALPADKLQQVWQSILGQVGAFQSVEGTRKETKDALEIIFVSCRFEKAELDAKVVFDKDRLVAGLFFVPSEPDVAGATSNWTPPPYAREDSFEEKEITVGSGAWRLPGSLSLPIGPGPFPAVVLVHGSGPHDRDETIGPNKPFRDLAWGLASQGVAVVRYEKRTKVHASALAEVRDLTVQQEVIDDALAAAVAARDIAKIDRVFILGHSLGGNLLPRILLGDERLAGGIILAGSTRPMEVVIAEQVDYIARLDGTVSKEEAGQIDEIKADLARLAETSFSASSPPVFGVPASYWIDMRQYDAVKAAKRVTRPMLILQGGRDYQVTKADYVRWERGLRARKNVRLRLFPQLDHFFVAGTGKSSPEEYIKEGQHVAAEVVDEIASWTRQWTSRARKP